MIGIKNELFYFLKAKKRFINNKNRYEKRSSFYLWGGL